MKITQQTVGVTTPEPSALLALGDDLLAHIARSVGPEDLLRLSAVCKAMGPVVSRPELWQPHVAALPSPRPPASTPDPRAAWLHAAAPHHLDASAVCGLPPPDAAILATALGHSTLVTSLADGRLSVHSAADGSLRRNLVGHGQAVTLLATDEDVVVGGGNSLPAHVWSESTGALRHVLADGAAGIVALLVRQGVIITAATDGAARIWSTADGLLLHTLAVAECPIYRLAASERWVVTAGEGPKVRVWSLRDGTLQQELATKRRVTQLAVSDDVVAAAIVGGHGLWGQLSQTVRIWSADSGAELRDPPLISESADSVTTLAVDEKTVVMGSARGWIDVLTHPWERSEAFAPLEVSVAVAAVGLRGDTLVACYDTGAVTVASVARRKLRQVLREGQARLDFGENGATSLAWRDELVTVARQNSLTMWRFDQPRPSSAPASFARAALDGLRARLDHLLWATSVYDW